MAQIEAIERSTKKTTSYIKWLISFLMILLLCGTGIYGCIHVEKVDIKEKLNSPKVGDIYIYRYQRNQHVWFYSEKLSRIEKESLFFRQGIVETNKINLLDMNHDRSFVSQEIKKNKKDLYLLMKEKGKDQLVIVSIKRNK
jgi:hypothetical protein